MEKKDEFEYTYSAPEQEELRKIREKYLPPEQKEQRESKMDKIRRLDQRAAKKGTVWSLVLGITSCLLFGLGMSMCMVWTDVVIGGVSLFWAGIPVGLVGMAGMACAAPLCKYVTARERRKIAPEILRLTDELMQ